MNNINANTRNSIKKGEEIFKIKDNKSIHISNQIIITNNKINQVKTNKIKLIKYGKEEIRDKNKMNKLESRELTNIMQRRTFIETNRDNNKSQLNNYMNKIIQNKRSKFFYSFIRPNINPVNNNNINKNKPLLKNGRNYKNNFFPISFFKNTIKKNSTTLINHRKKNTENLFNNKLKKRKDVIESYTNNKRITQKNNISNKIYDISKIIPKRINPNKKILHIKPINLNDKTTIIKKDKKEEKKENQKKENEKKEDNNFILDIESEHKKSINKLKIEDYTINKPHEYKMKFSLLKEFNDEENNSNDKNKVEKIMIGKIEGYKDIIESDKINIKNNLNKKNIIKNKLVKKTDKMIKENNNLKILEGFNIFEENSSEFYDLNLLNNNYCKTNKNLENIENEYEFEELSNYENENKINKNKFLLFNNDKAY